jgi:hypothetical protein
MHYSPSQPNGWWPQLSPDGTHVAYGTGDVFITSLDTLDTFKYAGGYFPRWKTRTIVTFLRFPTNNTGIRYEVTVGDWQEKEMPGDVTLVAVNDFDAANGHWAGTLSGHRAVYDGSILENAPVWGAKMAGEFFAVNHATENFIRVWKNGTPHADVPTHIPAHQFAIDDHGRIAYGFGGIRVASEDGTQIDALVSPTGFEHTPFLFTYHGRLWVATCTDMAATQYVLIRPVGEEPCIILECVCDHLNAFVMGDTLRLATSNNVGGMMVQDVSLLTARRRLEPRLSKPSQPVWAGYFYSFGRHGDWPSAPQNCAVVVDADHALVASVDVPVIITPNCIPVLKDRWDRVIALYVGPEGVIADNLREAEKAVLETNRLGLPRKPVVAYFTDGQMKELTPQTSLPFIDWIGIQAYFMSAPTPWQLQQFWADRLGRIPAGKKVAVIAQAYDRNGVWTNEKELAALQPYLMQPIYENKAIAFLMFAYARPGGAKFYPRMLEWHQAFVSVIDTPKIEAPMDLPRVTITSYDPKSGDAPLKVRAIYKREPTSGPIDRLEWLHKKPGSPLWNVAATNHPDDPDHTYTMNEAGTHEIRLRAIGPGGVGETAMKREVKVTSVVVEEPVGEDVPLPTYDDFLKVEGKEIDQSGLSSLDLAAHTAWRRLNENWTHANVLRDIRRQPLINHHQKQRLTSLTYDEWIREFNEIKNAFKARHHRMPTTSDIRHFAWRRFVERWTFARIISDITGVVVVPDPVTESKVEGRLRVQGQEFVNDGGVYRPNWVSALAILARTPDEAESYINWAAEKGFNGIRLFAGYLPWAPLTPERALEQLPHVLSYAASKGMYVEVTALTETKQGYDIFRHMDAINQIVSAVDNAVVEVANEVAHATQLNDLPVKELEGHVSGDIAVAVGAPDFDELQRKNPADENSELVFPFPIADYITLHLRRDRDKWNMVRRVREMEPVSEKTDHPVLNNEPIGADDVSRAGARESDPAIFFTMAVLNRLFEVGGVYHSQHGLHAVLPTLHQDWCANAYIQGSKLITTKSRMHFKNTRWADSPVREANFNNVVRVYSGLSDEQNVVVLVGLTGDPQLQMQNGWRVGNLLDEMPGVQVYELMK